MVLDLVSSIKVLMGGLIIVKEFSIKEASIPFLWSISQKFH